MALGLRLRTVACDSDGSNNRQHPKHVLENQPEFNWKKFWQFLQPQISVLIWAIIFALGAAVLNTQIPILLGQLVNIISHCISQHTPHTYVQDIKVPAIKLLLLYGLQVRYPVLPV
uniref:ATP-binding cassette sub-family B member 8, mitochondrial-like n=1 Tax=Callorhinchus milii TaxID=7868 RepID=A0A4W3GMJ7_CALMI